MSWLLMITLSIITSGQGVEGSETPDFYAVQVDGESYFTLYKKVNENYQSQDRGLLFKTDNNGWSICKNWDPTEDTCQSQYSTSNPEPIGDNYWRNRYQGRLR